MGAALLAGQHHAPRHRGQAWSCRNSYRRKRGRSVGSSVRRDRRRGAAVPGHARVSSGRLPHAAHHLPPGLLPRSHAHGAGVRGAAVQRAVAGGRAAARDGAPDRGVARPQRPQRGVHPAAGGVHAPPGARLARRPPVRAGEAGARHGGATAAVPEGADGRPPLRRVPGRGEPLRRGGHAHLLRALVGVVVVGRERARGRRRPRPRSRPRRRRSCRRPAARLLPILIARPVQETTLPQHLAAVFVCFFSFKCFFFLQDYQTFEFTKANFFFTSQNTNLTRVR